MEAPLLKSLLPECYSPCCTTAADGLEGRNLGGAVYPASARISSVSAPRTGVGRPSLAGVPESRATTPRWSAMPHAGVFPAHDQTGLPDIGGRSW